VAPAELDRILRKCLRKRCAERYQSARELFVDLSNLRRDMTEGRRAVGSRARSLGALEGGPALEISRGVVGALFTFRWLTSPCTPRAFMPFKRVSAPAENS
jgi:hypothetical protein